MEVTWNAIFEEERAGTATPHYWLTYEDHLVRFDAFCRALGHSGEPAVLAYCEELGIDEYGRGNVEEFLLEEAV